MSYRDDSEGYKVRLLAKLQPAAIRATMEFAALYQMTHQQIEQVVRDKVREFYCIEFDLDGVMTARDQERYKTEVLSLEPKNKFKASLRWLVRNDALSQHQADRLDAIYAHRNELAHELIRFIVDPDSDLDVDLLIEAIGTLKQLHRFWIDVEISIGGFVLSDGSEVSDADAEEVAPLSLMMLQKCLDAYLDGLPKPEDEQSA